MDGPKVVHKVSPTEEWCQFAVLGVWVQGVGVCALLGLEAPANLLGSHPQWV